MPKDRDAYELEPNSFRKAVLALAIEGDLHTEGGQAFSVDEDDFAYPLEGQFQDAYKELNRAGLLVGTTYTGRGHRAATDWGLLK
jgi:hypothetical protein